jgi:hypothetical protein
VTTGTDTTLATDHLQAVLFNCSSGCTEQIPEATTLGITAFTTNFVNFGTGDVTLTPTSWSFAQGVGILHQGQMAVLSVDPAGGAWDLNVFGSVRTPQVLVFNDIGPTTGDSGLITVLDPPVPIHITGFSCGVSGSTSATVNLSNGTYSLLGSNQTCTTGNANTVSTSTFLNTSSQCGATTSCAIPANTPISISVTSVSGSPSGLSGAITYYSY